MNLRWAHMQSSRKCYSPAYLVCELRSETQLNFIHSMPSRRCTFDRPMFIPVVEFVIIRAAPCVKCTSWHRETKLLESDLRPLIHRYL